MGSDSRAEGGLSSGYKEKWKFVAKVGVSG